MKQKIIAALKTAYAKLGLSDEAFDGVASLLEKTVAEESEIATAVGGDNVKNLLTTIQGQVDSWKNKFYDKDKELKTYKEAHPAKDDKKDDKADPDKKADEPEWVKEMREQNRQLLARLDARDKAEKDSENLSAVRSGLEKAGLTNKGILNATLKGFALGENETVEAAIERLKVDYNTNFLDVFGEGPVPPTGAGAFGDDPKKAAEAKNAMLRAAGLLPQETK